MSSIPADQTAIPVEQRVSDFLHKLRPGEWQLARRQLKADGTNGPWEFKCFDSLDVAGIAKWLSKPRCNHYMSLAEVKSGLGKKAEKKDVVSVHFYHADIDPDGMRPLQIEREQIWSSLFDRRPKGVPEPTVIIDSGGGYWGLWKCDAPINVTADNIDEIEQTNRWLETVYGGDNCHNIDRICRLPYTTNYPDTKKIAKGRSEAPTRAYQFHADRVYAPTDFGKQATARLPKGTPKKISVPPIKLPPELPKIESLDGLDVADRVKVIVNQGHHPDPEEVAKKTAQLGKPPSRSEWLFDAVCQLLRAHTPPATVMSLLLDPAWGISESVIDKGSAAHRYALRQITRGYERIVIDMVEDGLDFDEDGVLVKSAKNFITILTMMSVDVRYNSFTGTVEVSGGPAAVQHLIGELTDDWVAVVRVLIEAKFRWLPAKDFTFDTLVAVAHQRVFHPVRGYLDGLIWDGKPRLDTWLIECAGVKDTAYTRATSRLMLMGAVARVRRPGCKFDQMMVLESPVQGKNKSTAIEMLCPRAEWYTNKFPLNAASKEIVEGTTGKWIIECAELNGMTKGTVEKVKDTLSTHTDRARAAYGRTAKDTPRQWVSFGTSNNRKYLRDQTGNRRFWPEEVTARMDIEWIVEHRDQLWAEASHRVAAGESIVLPEELWAEAAVEQAERDKAQGFARGDTGEQAFEIVGVDRNGKWEVEHLQPTNAVLGQTKRREGMSSFCH